MGSARFQLSENMLQSSRRITTESTRTDGTTEQEAWLKSRGQEKLPGGSDREIPPGLGLGIRNSWVLAGAEEKTSCSVSGLHPAWEGRVQ